MDKTNIPNDLELINNIKKTKDEISLNELISRHSKIYYNVVGKFASSIAASGQHLEDVYKDKDLMIYECAMNFKPEKKCKISTHIANETKYKCLNLLNPRLNPHLRSTHTTDEEMTYLLESKAFELNYSKSNSHLLDYVFNILGELKDKRIKKIFEYKFLQDIENFTEIGKKLKVSHVTIRTLYKRGLKEIKRQLKKEENFELFDKK